MSSRAARVTRTLVVWCPDWPVAAAGVGADVPAAVFKANRVVACSAAARAEGVKRGLRRREAQERCPGLVVLADDRSRDARAFEPVVAAVEAFAPRVEVLRPGVCGLPTRGPSRYFGGDETLAAKVRAAVVGQTGHVCRVGVADGPFAATLAAREGRIVPPGESPAYLAPLSARALERPDLVETLARLGIRTLGEFAAVPVADVLARFGTDGAAAHRLARGLDGRPLVTRTPPPDLVVQRELDPPAQRVDTAAFVAKILADELHYQLASRGLACTQVVVEAETEHGEHLSRLWRHDGALTPAAMAERVRWQLDGWLARTARPAGWPDGDGRGDDDFVDDFVEPTAGLTLLRLIPDHVVPDDGRQLGFWGGGAEAGERAARSLARVQGMLGPEAVVTAVVSGGRTPNEQTTLVPWGDPRTPNRPAPAPSLHTALATPPATGPRLSAVRPADPPTTDPHTARAADPHAARTHPTARAPDPPDRAEARAADPHTARTDQPARAADPHAARADQPARAAARADSPATDPTARAADPHAARADQPARAAARADSPATDPTARAADPHAARTDPTARAADPPDRAEARAAAPRTTGADQPARVEARPADPRTGEPPPPRKDPFDIQAELVRLPESPNRTVPGVANGRRRSRVVARIRGRIRTPRRSPASEVTAWPGRVPSPAPATVHPRPVRAEVTDASGGTVAVTGRHTVTAPPARLSIDGARWVEITAWTGPWPADERWWDPQAHRRRARFQVVTAPAGAAYLLAVENGTWWVEAVYD